MKKKGRKREKEIRNEEGKEDGECRGEENGRMNEGRKQK